ncbi:MAG: radical SAM protein [Patescibacteria group bacterium]|nr:radical SAM protein [Patescibacteria group bacterium]
MKIRIIKTKAKTIFTKTRLPGVSYVINQYVGCDHLCLYCYARFTARWKNYGKWGLWVEAKINAPELVKNKYVKGSVWMSSVSDPYQHVEKRLKLTRKVLKNMNKRINLAVQTKSDLILRDVDLFKEFKNIEIGLTVNGFNKKAKELFEPYSSTHEKRLKTLKSLKQQGIKTYAFVSPIIPGLVDVKKVISQTKSLADYYFFETINTRGAGKEFVSVLEKEFPDSWEILKDKEKFNGFVADIKQIVKKEKIKSRGVFVH